MKPERFIIIGVIGLALGAGSGVLFKQWQEHNPTPLESGTEQLVALPVFSYRDLDNNLRHSTEWSNKIMVLNFWATWCPPCRKETPGFVELQQTYEKQGVQFVGIAIDDPQPVKDFADNFGINYPVLLGDMSAVSISKQLGNRFEGLPYTVVARPGGDVVLRHSGELTRKDLEQTLQKLISKS